MRNTSSKFVLGSDDRFFVSHTSYVVVYVNERFIIR